MPAITFANPSCRTEARTEGGIVVAAVLAGVIVPWARETLLEVAILVLEVLRSSQKTGFNAHE